MSGSGGGTKIGAVVVAVVVAVVENSAPVAVLVVPVAVDVTGVRVAMMGGATITVPLGVVVLVVSEETLLALVVLLETVVAVVVISSAAALVVAVLDAGVVAVGVLVSEVVVGSDDGAGVGVDSVLVSFDVETVLTVSVVSANAILKNVANCFKTEFSEVPVAIGVVVEGVFVFVPVVVVSLVDEATSVVAVTTDGDVASDDEASPGISHTSVRPTFLISPCV